MRNKFIIIILSILPLLVFTSCKKETLPLGKYSAETRDGVLYLTLLDGKIVNNGKKDIKNCIFQFEDGEEVQGGYYISKGTIHLFGMNIYPLRMNDKIRWVFDYNDSYGKMHNGSFSVNASRVFYDETRRFAITFNSLYQ